MKIIGVTGGICSGKTTVCNYLEILGYKVFYSDQVALKLVETNKKLQIELTRAFGKDVFIGNIYNRQYVSSIVFNNKEELEKLNRIFKYEENN